MEIDVSKCKYYDCKDCLCEYDTFNWEIEKFYQCKDQDDCYYKQLQQLKAENELLKNERTIDLRNQLEKLKEENEKLCTAIRNELHDQYDKRVSEAESDIEWGVLDRNATEAEFCKNVIFETRNYITKLKAENEELKNKNNAIHSIADDLQQRNHNLTLENEELKNTVTCLRTELDKQKTRLKEYIAKLEQENEELKSKLALFSDVDYAYENTNLTYDLMENDSKKLYLTDEQVDNMCRYVVDLCKSKLFVSNKLFREENEKLKQDLQEETKLGHKAMCDEADMAWEVHKLQKVLDEIEEICQNETINLTDSCVNGGRYFEILQLIEQAKEGE